MKPCVQNRKLIVWLTLNALDSRQTRQLRAHLETCAGCRRHLAEISRVTERLAVAETTPDVVASESFHRKVAGKLRAAKPDSFGEIVLAYFARLNRPMALPVIAVLGLSGVIIATWPQPVPVASLPSVVAQVLPPASADNDLEPTIANYQRAADQSLDKLDALLTRQGNRALPSMPVYTASTRTLAKESF